RCPACDRWDPPRFAPLITSRAELPHYERSRSIARLMSSVVELPNFWANASASSSNLNETRIIIPGSRWIYLKVDGSYRWSSSQTRISVNCWNRSFASGISTSVVATSRPSDCAMSRGERTVARPRSIDFDGAISATTMAYALLLFIPLSVALRYVADAPAGWVFLTGAAAIAVLADWLRRATDQLAERAGSTIGGLLNISFGNTAELILALFVLSRVNTRIVQAQITGSIIGTTLLFLGISALVGGVGRVRQTFSQASAGLLWTLLFVVVVAILLPAVFDLTERIAAPGMNTSLIDERLSLGVSVVL